MILRWLAIVLSIIAPLCASAQNNSTIFQGKTGDRGYTGARGPSGTIAIHNIVTGDPGTPASVVNVGTQSNALFDITVPRGSVFYSGSGAPSSSTGGNQDFYFRTDTGCIYGPKTTSGWPSSCTNLATTANFAGPQYKLVAYNGSPNGSGYGAGSFNASTDSTGNDLSVPGSLNVGASNQFGVDASGNVTSSANANFAGALSAGVATVNSLNIGSSFSVGNSGDVVAKTLSLGADPTANMQAATKQYVDSHLFTGGAVTNPIVLPADPTANLQAATKQYVDNNHFNGGTVTNPIVLPADPTTNLQAATKQYVDTHSATGAHYQTIYVPNTTGTVAGIPQFYNTGSPNASGAANFNDRVATTSGWITSVSMAYSFAPAAVTAYIVVGTISGGSMTITAESSFSLPSTTGVITLHSGTDYSPIQIAAGQYLGIWVPGNSNLPAWGAPGASHSLYYFFGGLPSSGSVVGVGQYTSDDFAISGTIQPTLPQESALNISGPQVTCSDDSGNKVTNCSLLGSSGSTANQVQLGDGAGKFSSSGALTFNPSGNILNVGGGVAVGSYANTNTPPANTVIIPSSIGIGNTNPTHSLDIGSVASIDNTGNGTFTKITSPITFSQSQFVVPGYNYGAPGAGPSTGWGGPTQFEQDFNSAQSGIANFMNLTANSNGVGDFNGINFYWHWNGGSIAGSDEGGTGVRNYPFLSDGDLIGTIYPNGISTSSTSHRIYLTGGSLSGGATIGVGRDVINLTTDVQSITTTAASTIGAVNGSYSLQTTSVPLDSSAVSIQSTLNAEVDVAKGSNGVVSDLYINTTTPWTVGSMFTCSGPFVEESKVITADAISGGVQHITATLYKTHIAGETCFAGGWAGRRAESPSATALTGVKHLFWVLGVTDTSHIAIARAVPNGFDVGYTGTGPYNIYHGTTVVDARDDIGKASGYQFNVSDWDGTWNVGDRAEVTVPLTQHFALWAEEFINFNPYSEGNHFNIEGQIGPTWGTFLPGTSIFNLRNDNPDSAYTYAGGSYHVAGLFSMSGPQGTFAYFNTAPHGSFFEVQNTQQKTFNPIQLDDNGGGFTQISTLIPGLNTYGTYFGQQWIAGAGGNASQADVRLSGTLTDAAGFKYAPTGCSLSSQLGGDLAGQFTAGVTGTCTVTLKMSTTVPNGFACTVNDLTTPTNSIKQTATTANTVTLSGTSTSGDVLNYICLGY